MPSLARVMRRAVAHLLRRADPCRGDQDKESDPIDLRRRPRSDPCALAETPKPDPPCVDVIARRQRGYRRDHVGDLVLLPDIVAAPLVTQHRHAARRKDLGEMREEELIP